MNKHKVTMIRKRIEPFFEEIGEEFNVTLILKRIFFDDSSFKVSVKCTEGRGLDALRNIWNKNCWKFDLQPNDFDKSFTYQGYDYHIREIAQRCDSKYPVRCMNLTNGKIYKFPVDIIKDIEKNGDLS